MTPIRRPRRLARGLAFGLVLVAAALAVPGAAGAAPASPAAAAAVTACPSGGPTGTTNIGDAPPSGGATGTDTANCPGGPGGGGSSNPYPMLHLFCNPWYYSLEGLKASGYRYVSSGPIGSLTNAPGIKVGGLTFYTYDARNGSVGPGLPLSIAHTTRTGARPALALVSSPLRLVPRLPAQGGSPADSTYVEAVVECFDANGNYVNRVLVIVTPGQLGVDPLVLRDQARAQITLTDPPLDTNPPFDQPGRFGVVRVPTWFWLDPAWWTPQTGTAAQGGLTVTVTATPQVATWAPGDGSTVTCNGPGTPWQAGLADSAATCSHTFSSSSADQPGAAYQLSASVRWEFTWTLNGVDQGAFGTVATVAPPVAFQVGEIQAISSH